MFDPWQYAEAAGLAVHTHPMTGRQRGCYIAERRLILLRPGLTARQQRWTLAHELGHHEHGDAGCPVPVLAARAELRADRWAARNLITPRAWAAATRTFEHPLLVANELDVPPLAVPIYAEMLAAREQAA